MRATTRFVPGHKDGFHNGRRAIRPERSDPVAPDALSGTSALSLAEAAAAAGKALARLGRLAASVTADIERARHAGVDAKRELAEIHGEVDLVRAQVQDLTAELAAVPSVREADVTAGVVTGGAPANRGGTEETKTIARALMVAVRAERARASAAETQAAALLAQLNRTLERLIDEPPTLPSAGVVAEARTSGAERPDLTTEAVPFRSQRAHRWSVTVPLTSGQDAGEFGSLERLGDDGLLTADEAAALATATAMGVVRTLGPTSELPGVLAGTIRPHGLDAEANRVVDRHWRTLDRLARQGHGDLVGPIVEGAVSYCGADDLDDDPN